MKIGILGSGQLGRMLALAGIPLGYEFAFYDSASDGCARTLGSVTVGSFSDEKELEAFAKSVDIVTYEFENVPFIAAKTCARYTKLFPSDEILFLSQHRGREKELFTRCNIPTPQNQVVNSKAELLSALTTFSLPVVLKTTTEGYDGKGQMVLNSVSEAESAWSKLGERELIIEAFVPFKGEISVIAARAASGDIKLYPIAKNVHRAGILRTSQVPSGYSEEIERKAHSYITTLLNTVQYVGVCALELFVLENGELFANECAPRVHNTGHWSIDGAVTGQFENHLRAITGLPLGEVTLRAPSTMVNLIGDTPPLSSLAQIGEAKIHLYGKLPREGRKIGHITIVHSEKQVHDAALQKLSQLGIK